MCEWVSWLLRVCRRCYSHIVHMYCTWCCRFPHYIFLIFGKAFAERGFEGRGLYVCRCSSWYQSSTPECASLANPSPPGFSWFEVFDFPIEPVQQSCLARLGGLLGCSSTYSHDRFIHITRRATPPSSICRMNFSRIIELCRTANVLSTSWQPQHLVSSRQWSRRLGRPPISSTRLLRAMWL